jgi:hypothetical protein
MMTTPTAAELRHALHGLAARADVIVQHTNAALTLMAYAERFGVADTPPAEPAPRAQPAPPPTPQDPVPDPEPTLEAAAIYAARRASVAAQAAPRRTAS